MSHRWTCIHSFSRAFQMKRVTTQTLPSLWHCYFSVLCAWAFWSVRAAPRTTLLKNNSLNDSHVESIMRHAKAAEMGNYMNESANPCDNFYSFACGNWARINPAQLPSDLTTGSFERISQALNRKMLQILKSEPDAIDTPEDEQVKRFYKACTGLSKLSDSYTDKLKQIIGEFGQMPVLMSKEEWLELEEHFDWVETSARMTYRYGIGPILTVQVMKDFADNKVNILYIGAQDFLLETRSMYLDNHTYIYRNVYKKKITKTLQSFLKLPAKLASATASELLDFEVELARGLLDEREGLDIGDMSDLTTVADMQRRYAPSLNIERLVNISLGETVTDSIYEFNPAYQQNLLAVLKRTPIRVVANYIYFMLINAFAREPAKTGIEPSDSCVETTKKYFANNLDNMIWRRFNNNSTAEDVMLIWHELKSTFKSTLQSAQLNWIARPTRQYAIQKLKAMTLEINSYANFNFTEAFDGLQLVDNDYVENLRSTFMCTARTMRQELHKPAKPLEAGELLSYTPANILVENTIKVPVSMLQPYYMWAASYPNALKFGTLGSLIGHELVHGFDDTGRKFDLQGNMDDWWDESSVTQFQEHRQCFTNQYSRYIYNGRYLPESTGQSENIADNGGLRLAYAAYLNWYEDALRGGWPLQETLPTLSYTSKQLFFISYAQLWCNDALPQVRNLQVSMDDHVPGQFRVIGPLSNFDEFAKEFNCAKGTKMNPISKCAIY